jgi:hypothetical protein
MEGNMKLTNRFNLPEVFVNLLTRSTYSKGKAHLSATELLNSPQIVQLKRKHWDDLEEDVSDKIFALFGTAMHSILEHGKTDGSIVEQRLHVNVDGWDISGAIDLQEPNENGISIKDYKTTGAWAVMNEKIEWEQQLNIYAYLVEKVKKVPVTDLAIVAIIRDWSRRDAQTKEHYPNSPIKVISIPLWDYDKRERFIKERIQLHSNAHLSTEMGEGYVSCTPDEMWETETVYAIRKIGNVRAKSLHKSQDEADQKLSELGKDFEVEVRKGERRRCKDYCQVNQFCQQYQQYLMEQV